MGKKLIILVLICIWSLTKSFAQNTLVYTEKDRYFREGMDLFYKQQYGAARVAFEEYLVKEPNSIKAIDAEYYIAYSAMSLYHNDGEYLLEEFVKKKIMTAL